MSKQSDKADKNTMVKKKRRSKFKFYFLNILLAVVILGVIFVFCSIFFCRVTKVSCKGNKIYNDEQIEYMVLSHPYDGNSLAAVGMSIFKPVKSIPFVDSIKLKLVNAHSIEIIVKEKPLSGFLPYKNNKYIYYNNNGMVNEISDTLIDKTPLIAGLTLKSTPKLGEILPVDQSKEKTLLYIQKELLKRKIVVSAVVFNAEGNITLMYQNITINLGMPTKLSEKITRLPYILPHLEQMTGTLHLEDWSEENTDIVFQKNE